jgi:hypothetical protein
MARLEEWEEAAIARQQLLLTRLTTIEKLLEVAFSMQSKAKLHSEHEQDKLVSCQL